MDVPELDRNPKTRALRPGAPSRGRLGCLAHVQFGCLLVGLGMGGHWFMARCGASD